MTNKTTLSVLLAAVAMTSVAFAQQTQTPAAAPTATPAQTPAPAAAEEGSALTLDASVKYVTAYFSRGFNFGDSGLILQPEATIAYAYKANDKLTITPWFNVWNNITDQHYSTWDHWDEIDLTPGVDFTCDRFTLSLQYIYYHSPAENWADDQEIGAVLSYDDSDRLGLPIALNPYVGVFHEIHNQGGDERSYLEVGMKPKWTPDEKCPVTLTFPLALGMSLDDFYFDDDGDETLLGFASASVVATYNITDHLYMTAGVKYMYLIADNVREANDGDQNQFVGGLGIGYTF